MCQINLCFNKINYNLVTLRIIYIQIIYFLSPVAGAQNRINAPDLKQTRQLFSDANCEVAYVSNELLIISSSRNIANKTQHQTHWLYLLHCNVSIEIMCIDYT